MVARYTPERAAAITGLSAEDIAEAARLFAGAERAMLIYSMGITQHSHGVDNVKSCANLAMLTGNVGRPGTGVNALRGQNNVQGACDAGALPDVYSGYQKVSDEAVRRTLPVSMARLAQDLTLSTPWLCWVMPIE